jgi:hypothetical protein
MVIFGSCAAPFHVLHVRRHSDEIGVRRGDLLEARGVRPPW